MLHEKSTDESEHFYTCWREELWKLVKHRREIDCPNCRQRTLLTLIPTDLANAEFFSASGHYFTPGCMECASPRRANFKQHMQRKYRKKEKANGQSVENLFDEALFTRMLAEAAGTSCRGAWISHTSESAV